MSLVSLSTQELAFLELKQALVYKEKQNGLILLVGKSGLGKSLLLKRLCKDKEAILFERAFFNEDALLRGLFEEAFKDGLRAKNHNLKEGLSKEGADLFASTFKQEAFKQDKANKFKQQSQNGKNSNQISQNKFKLQDQNDKENKGSFKSKQMQDKSSHTTKCVNFLKQERRIEINVDEFKEKTQTSLEGFAQQSQKSKCEILQNTLTQQSQKNQIPHNKFKPQDQITRGLNSHQKFKPNKENRQIQANHKEYHQIHTKHTKEHQIQDKHSKYYKIHTKHKEDHQLHTKHKEYHQIQAKHKEDRQIQAKLRNTKLDFELLYDSLKESNKKLIFLLDEVGVYDECLLERIRLLSELSNLCFVLSLHKKQACFLKEHFSSRIIKEIELNPLNLKEFELYVREKFKLSLKTNLLKSLLKLSRANLRLVDKILHSFLTLHTFYTKENKDPSQKRLLQMSLFYHNLLGKR